MNPKLWHSNCIFSQGARHCGFPMSWLFPTTSFLSACSHEKPATCKRVRNSETSRKGQTAFFWRNWILVTSKCSSAGIYNHAPSRRRKSIHVLQQPVIPVCFISIWTIVTAYVNLSRLLPRMDLASHLSLDPRWVHPHHSSDFLS